MQKEFFEFCHLLYQSDEHLRLSTPDQAYFQCLEASIEYARDHMLGRAKDPQEWIERYYELWAANFVYISSHMPENCKQILKSK